MSSTTCKMVRVRTADGRVVWVKKCYPTSASLTTARSLSGYVQTRPARGMGAVRQRGALGASIWDIIANPAGYAEDQNRAEQLRCLEAANSSAQVKNFEAKIANLLATWNPLPTVSRSELARVADELESASNNAKAEVRAAPESTSDAASVKRQALSDLELYVDERVRAYRAALAAGATIVKVPDLKKNVAKALTHVMNAYVARSVLDCRMSALDRAAYVVDRLIGAVKSVVGRIIEITDKVVTAATAPLNVIGWLGKYPVIPVGIAAVILYKIASK